jgi:hypothetical protein
VVRQVREECGAAGLQRRVKFIKLIGLAALAALTIVGQASPPASQSTGQPAAGSASPREVAQKRAAEWETLAKALDAKIARMLPCDPRAKEAIVEVSRASEARLTAVGEVLKVEIAQNRSDTERVRLALTAEDFSLREAELERADSNQERIAVESQVSELNGSTTHLSGFNDARKKLGDIAASVTKRFNIASDQLERRANLGILLRDMQAGLQTRQTALQNEKSSLDAETARWNEYYSARLARSQTECSITGAPSRPQRKKR